MQKIQKEEKQQFLTYIIKGGLDLIFSMIKIIVLKFLDF